MDVNACLAGHLDLFQHCLGPSFVRRAAEERDRGIHTVVAHERRNIVAQNDLRGIVGRRNERLGWRNGLLRLHRNRLGLRLTALTSLRFLFLRRRSQSCGSRNFGFFRSSASPPARLPRCEVGLLGSGLLLGCGSALQEPPFGNREEALDQKLLELDEVVVLLLKVPGRGYGLRRLLRLGLLAATIPPRLLRRFRLWPAAEGDRNVLALQEIEIGFRLLLAAAVSAFLGFLGGDGRGDRLGFLLSGPTLGGRFGDDRLCCLGRAPSAGLGRRLGGGYFYSGRLSLLLCARDGLGSFLFGSGCFGSCSLRLCLGGFGSGLLRSSVCLRYFLSGHDGVKSEFLAQSSSSFGVSNKRSGCSAIRASRFPEP